MIDGYLIKESEALLQFLEDRGLTPAEACAVMGISIAGLINSKDEARTFLVALANTLDESTKGQQ